MYSHVYEIGLDRAKSSRLMKTRKMLGLDKVKWSSLAKEKWNAGALLVGPWLGQCEKRGTSI